MNRVILCGRLVRDPEIRYSQGNNATAIAKFTLAVDRKFKKDGEQSADFINCVAFGKVAETVEKYVHQGNKIIVEGHWQTGSYTNKDGVKVYTNDCAVESIEFCESKSQQSQNSSNDRPQPSSNDGFMSLPMGVEDTGLPFN
ncbi:MAG: single-stranded DNA-binding protein [Agathobacter sp.]|nr:single-stranded DNA-binding protein [Agathobacter sp.]